MDDARCRNCGSWDVDSDAFGAEYEQHLIKMAHSLYPQHRMYEANGCPKTGNAINCRHLIQCPSL